MSVLDARRIVEPTEEPLTLSEAKLHLRVDSSDEDALISSLITVARMETERVGWLSVCTQTWRLHLTGWPSDPILLPRHPVQSISSLKWYDTAAVSQTLTPTVYALAPAAGMDAYLWLAANQAWPSAALSDQPYPLAIEYVTGFGGAIDVPRPIKQYMLLLLGALYENRESVVVAAGVTSAVRLPFADNLLDEYRGFRY